MTTYIVTMERIKTVDELKKVSNFMTPRNQDKKIELVKKWDEWLTNNEYYANHKFRHDGIMALLFKVKIDGITDLFTPAPVYSDIRAWLKQFTYDVNEYSFIFAESHSFNKSNTCFYVNAVVLSSSESGRLSYRAFSNISVMRRLQKTFAQVMRKHDIYGIGQYNQALLKPLDKSDRGILLNNKDLPVKNDNESDDDYYKRVNAIFQNYCGKYKESIYKRNKQIEAKDEQLSKIQAEMRDNKPVIVNGSNEEYKAQIESLNKQISSLKSELESWNAAKELLSKQVDDTASIKEQLNEYITVTNAYGGMKAIKLGMRFASVIKYARRYYIDKGNKEMAQHLDRMVTDGENYARENGVDL